MLCAADMFTMSGGVFEAGGIVLTVRELVRVENRTFPERRDRLVRAARKIRRFFGRPLTPVSRTFTMPVDVGAVASLIARVTRPPVGDHTDVAARIARLEKVVDDRDREHREAIEEIHQGIVSTRRIMSSRIDEIEERQNHKESDERAALADSLALQKAGAVLFVIGAALSTIGGVAS